MKLYCLLVAWVITVRCTVCEEDPEDEELVRKCKNYLPDCQCYDLVVVGGVRCWNASSLFTTRYLQNGMIFEVNETYEITIEGGVTFLPPRGLEGLIVFRLILEDPVIEYVDKNAFDGVLRLRRFHVRSSSIKNVPDFRPIRNSLRNLNLDNSQLTLLEGDGLKGLDLLETVSFLNNSIRQVAPDVFNGTNNVVVFDLSYNKLTSLPPHLFDSWKKLRKVALSHNNLLHVNQLFAHARPWFIYLDYNNISDLDSILYPYMSNMTTLLLAHNPIEKVTPSSFNGKTPDIRFIYMDHCKIRTFDVTHYQSLPKLNTLDLSYNELEIISPQKIAFGYSLELVMQGNRIRNFQAEVTHTVKRAYLSDNRLQSLGSILRFSQLSEVSVDQNQLQQLRREDFSGLNELSILNLHNNQIKWIDRRSFSTVRNDLHYLDLSCNLLTSLNGSVMFLSQLKYLNLTSNLITTFEEGEFAGLNELSELYLLDNLIVTLGQLQQLPELQFLVLAKNRIQTLKKEQIPKTLQYLYLMDNPIRCDCQLLPFVQWLNSSGSPGTDAPLCAPVLPHLSVLTSGHSCPENCRCFCTKGAEEYFMSLDCSSNNMSSLPQLLTAQPTPSLEDSASVKIFLPRRNLDNNPDFTMDIEIEDTIGGIDLSNNSLETLEDARLPPGLRHLRLHNNLLQDLPPSLLTDFPRLRRVTLSGNPWRCDCDAVDFRKWILSKMDIIGDVNRTRCGEVSESESSELEDKVIWTLDDRDLCPTAIGLIFLVMFGLIAFFLVVTVSKILYTRYELQIKVWLYAHGVTCVKEKDIDRDKQFDAFMSFSHKDQDFVINELISAIESKKPNVRLCLHYKHFMPGEYIHDNIMSAVRKSKRTVLVLSRNFLESEWCLMEFRAAHVQALKDRVHRIIVIKVGDLPKEIDPSIQLYLDSTTYLTWGDKYFWNNLLYVLPTSGNKRDLPRSPTLDSVLPEGKIAKYTINPVI